MDEDDKKVNGIYAIENQPLKWDMLELMSGGDSCESIEAFEEMVFKHHRLERFIVCPSPGQFHLDLNNEIGAASPIDAIHHYIDLFICGYTFYVWDQVSKRAFCIDSNEYIYQPLDEFVESEVRNSVQKSRAPGVAELLKQASHELMNCASGIGNAKQHDELCSLAKQCYAEYEEISKACQGQKRKESNPATPS